MCEREVEGVCVGVREFEGDWVCVLVTDLVAVRERVGDRVEAGLRLLVLERV